MFPLKMNAMLSYIKDNTPHGYTLIKAGKHEFCDQYFAIYIHNNQPTIKKHPSFDIKVKMGIPVNGRIVFFENKVIRYQKESNGRIFIEVHGVGKFYLPGKNETGKKAKLDKHELVLFELD